MPDAKPIIPTQAGPPVQSGTVPPPPPAEPQPVAVEPTTERPATYREVFAVREYRHLFSANTLSLLGDQLARVALSFLVFSRSNSAALAATAFAVSYLPWIAFGPVLASYTDRFPRRAVMITCDLGRLFLVLLLVIPGLPTGALIGILFTANLFTPPFLAARASTMPDVFDDDRYVVANGLDNIVNQLCQVLGFALGGALVMLLTARGALLVDASTFLISALLITSGVQRRPVVSASTTTKNPVRDMVSAAKFVFRDKRLRAYLLLFWYVSAFTYAAEGLAPPLAKEFGGGPTTGGVILAAAPLGLASGAFVLARLCPPRLRLRLLLPLAMLSCAALIPTWIAPHLAVVIILLALAGIGSSFNVPLNPLFVRALPADIRGKAFGVAVSGVNAAQGLATVGAGILVDVCNLPATVVISCCGVVGTLGTLAIGRIWPHHEEAVSAS